ncbi:MAG: radical SAM protein [Candidatus Omnitrophota bacterium]
MRKKTRLNYKKQLEALNIIFKVKLFNKRTPLAIRWQLTEKCPSKCEYCKIWKSPSEKELPTKIIFKLLEEIKRCGTKKISFSGGEPLLREDIGDIITYCKRLGISPEMNSTGYLFEKKAKELKALDLLKISLDGPADINELVRGKKESYNWAINAASCAQTNKIFFIFTTTLTKFNIKYIDDILAIAKKFNTIVAFQPLKEIEYKNTTGKLDSIEPLESLFKQTINKLISYKKQNNFLLRNSLRGLHHIYNWPQYEKLKCWGGKIFCMIAANGEISPCDRLKYDTKIPNCAEVGFKEAFNNLPDLPPCSGCGFCGTIELNYLMAFKLDILHLIRKILL